MIIDTKNRRIIIEKATMLSLDSEPRIINEFDKVDYKFLPNTHDVFETELVFVDTELNDENGEPTGEVETKPFMRRVGREDWLMNFNLEDYHI